MYIDESYMDTSKYTTIQPLYIRAQARYTFFRDSANMLLRGIHKGYPEDNKYKFGPSLLSFRKQYW